MVRKGRAAGIDHPCICKKRSPSNPNLFILYSWWEILPTVEVPITSIAVAPGDEISVTIYQVTGTDWSITLTDDTNGESFTTDQTFTGSQLSAEWIVEATEVNGAITTLAPYSPTVTFSDLGITPPNTTLTEVVMTQNGAQVSTPSGYDTNGSFSVAYGSAVPPEP